MIGSICLPIEGILVSFRILAFTLALFIAAQANADVYRCQGTNGHATYQSTPCPDGVSTGISTQNHDPLIIPSTHGGPPTVLRGPDGRILRSEAAKDAFKRAHPCPSTGLNYGPCPGYVIDHIKPLACSGPDDPSNMQWQSITEGKVKDKWERDGCDGKGSRQADRKVKIDSSAGSNGYSGNGPIYTGPRGGRYYITESGKKRYLSD